MAQGIRKIGIVGAGQMGSGIAHVCALAGIPVVLNDIASQRMKDALATINGNMARQVSRKRITEEQKAAGLKLTSGSRGDDESFKFNDPDGFVVQVNGPKYTGHVGADIPIRKG